jgi:hypothetical protein
MTDTGSVTAGSKKKKIAFLLQDGVTCRTALVYSPIQYFVDVDCGASKLFGIAGGI